MNLSETLGCAWELVRRDRTLWVLRAFTNSNFLLFCVASVSCLLVRFFLPGSQSNGDRLARLWTPEVRLSLFLLLGLAALLISFLDTLGRTVLALRVARGQEVRLPGSLPVGLRLALVYSWRARQIRFVLGLPFLLLLFLLALSIPVTLGLSLLCLLPLLPLVVPVDLVFAAWREESLAVCVLENRSGVESLREGWRRFRAGWKPLSLLALVLRLGFGLVTLTLVFLPLAVPAGLFIFSRIPGVSSLSTPATTLVGVGLWLSLALLLLLNSLVSAFADTAWTLASRRCFLDSPL